LPDLIHLLPDNIANQIAAGEVIQRPASAVKELLENAVDAGASDIRLIVNDAGKSLIQVIDNGKGMSATQAPTPPPSLSNPAVLTASQITKQFGGLTAVSDVSLVTVMRLAPSTLDRCRSDSTRNRPTVHPWTNWERNH